MYDKNLSQAGIGAFMFAIDTSAFGTDQVNARMEELISIVLGADLAEGNARIYLPGERSSQIATERQVSGIPISPPVFEKINKIAFELGVSPLSSYEGGE